MDCSRRFLLCTKTICMGSRFEREKPHPMLEHRMGQTRELKTTKISPTRRIVSRRGAGIKEEKLCLEKRKDFGSSYRC